MNQKQYKYFKLLNEQLKLKKISKKKYKKEIKYVK